MFYIIGHLTIFSSCYVLIITFCWAAFLLELLCEIVTLYVCQYSNTGFKWAITITIM